MQTHIYRYLMRGCAFHKADILAARFNRGYRKIYKYCWLYKGGGTCHKEQNYIRGVAYE